METFTGVAKLFFVLPITFLEWIKVHNKTSIPSHRAFFTSLVRVICDANNDTITKFGINPLAKSICRIVSKIYGFSKYNDIGYWVRSPRKSVESGTRSKLLLYIHGGGFVIGLLPKMFIELKSLAATLDDEVAVLVLDYPVMENCSKITEFVWTEYCKLAKEFTEIDLIGDSCGGNLVFNILTRCHESNVTLPQHAIAISPWCDVLDLTSIKLQPVNVDLLSAKSLTHFQLSYTRGVADPNNYRQFLELKSVPKEIWTEILTQTKIYVSYGELELFRYQIEEFVDHIGCNSNLILEKIPNGFHIQPLVILNPQMLEKWSKFLSQ
ncbi:unnamed protein product [Kluyveromyces dobzhanskii CBS 2104]|uniref:WGS project CCBQ000000000 data, contig 00006 n=1 Tax=Kluyveromyces dobzhanskii CBS 2104 TaxID=1427455 RepID=A0A0A8L891_9SACH|nr:unnamed protein product [Kluyveromyces dobzhanskii CBS 2104]